MISLTRRNIIWFVVFNMSLCLITHAGSIHRPTITDEEFLALLDSNGLFNNDYENSNRDDARRALFSQQLSPSLYDDYAIRRLVNHHNEAKRSKLNLHTSLNLPRYLRTIY
jgi:hypothetical protein